MQDQNPESETFIIVRVKLDGSVHHLAINKKVLSVWELPALDPPHNTQLVTPMVGQTLDFAINGLYGSKIRVVAIQNTSSGFRVLYPAGYYGMDEVIHNYSTGACSEFNQYNLTAQINALLS